MMYEVIGLRNNFEIKHADCVINKKSTGYEVMTYMPTQIVGTFKNLSEARNACFNLGFIME